MMFRSIALNTDAMVMRGLSVYEEHEDRIVLRTPSEPNYWSGNSVIFRQIDDPAAQVARFKQDFPISTHLTVLWDEPNADVEAISVALGGGRKADRFEVLTRAGAIPTVAAPTGIVLRALGGDADWDALAALQCEVASEEGFDPALHRPFLEKRNTARRKQIAGGEGQWFGAFDGATLVGTMGMFVNDRFARFQAVETRATYRRRGICSALLAHVSSWAHDQSPSALQVIETAADSDAGRLYAKVGFAVAEHLVEYTEAGY